MPSISGAASVESAHVHGAPHTAQPPDLFHPVRALFHTSSPTGDALEGRALKRRRLADSDSATVAPRQVAQFDADKSVVLAKVALDLRRPTTPTTQLEGPRNPIEVSFESYARRGPATFEFSLWSANTPTAGVHLVATTTAGVLDSIASHLEAATTLSTTADGKKLPNRQAACFCRCLLLPSSHDAFRLELEIRWLVGIPVVETLRPKAPSALRDMTLLSRYFPKESKETHTPWTLSDFYDTVHVPSADVEVARHIPESLPETNLYPFQQRAVDWLLRREGVAYSNPRGELEPVRDFPTTPICFTSTEDANQRPCYVSHLRGMVTADLSATYDSIHGFRGGILAEEMGLGKTVELIALMCLHRRQLPEGDVYDPFIHASVKPSRATLIISPPSILEQWMNEITAHAPHLKAYHYTGLASGPALKKNMEEANVETLTQFDVVLTTYTVLSRELHFARPPPDRSLRHEKLHEPRKSPLVGISWWRVCFDEAQMVESGVSQAATIARLIPRCNAWAVSGTPLRKDVQDLRGLLIFLRCEPFATHRSVWDRLDKPLFRAIFSQIAMRHTKNQVRDELQLPPQKRVVITVPFTAIEEQNYAEMIRQMCDACGLSAEGVPTQEDRGADHPDVIERMREWLVRLRQTCLHAHVGQRNRKALGGRNGALRTVHEVLEVMIEQNDTMLKAEAREWILALVRCGHVKANAKDVEERAQTALPLYQAALEDTRSYVESCTKDIVSERERVGLASSSPTGLSGVEHPDSNDKDTPENLGRIPAIRKSLRSFLELEHACKFFIGTAYFQMKSNENLTTPDSEDFRRLERLEIEWYENAKVIRKELLKDVQSKAQRQMKRISNQKPFRWIPYIDDLPDLGGIESRKILDTMDSVADTLNAQVEQLRKWRSKIAAILLMPLVDEEDKETTGDEYDDSKRVQDELYVYVLGYRTLVADRHAAVNGLQDLLADHEMKTAELLAQEKKGHAPELVLEVAAVRHQLKPKDQVGSLKGVVSGARSLITALQWKADGDERAAAELVIVQKQLDQIQTITSEQTKALVELEKEQELFRGAMNQRLEFYRQLQHISDTVAPWKEQLDPLFDHEQYALQLAMRHKSEKQLAGLKTKHAYLINLRHENQQEDRTQEQECIICQDTFSIGVMTSCGHKYCKICINTWWHAHRTCPLCKKKLRSADLRDINLKPCIRQVQEEGQEVIQGQGNASQLSSPSSSNVSIYSDISDSTLKEINMIDLDGSYGTKVDGIARHLLWIRNNDPGAKSIIFSQFGDFLDVLREALKKWKIGASGIKDKSGIYKFRNDPAVECFLLDAKSDSSGLNLVNATYVFLCEPLVNPAIELQAIARVHRIGQQRVTTVFMYLVSDTVEEAIYDISVSRRLAHIGEGENAGATTSPALQEQTLDAANSLEMEAAPLKQLLGQKGDGEVVQVDDLWHCLFGKTRKWQPHLRREVDRHLRAEAVARRVTEAAEN
ncbi:ATP-dependent DNA helicase [Massariosphaeria phaeospora]|uniref:ATP-dependent DNA helicase n=1 Tax=Massariosphaeria phaeospora TaxID=100035 RepID=A0A7C8ID40_9PLEO|nr:ATP-dependent DNA helicase [Massariosphaeria phaeospora]